MSMYPTATRATNSRKTLVRLQEGEFGSTDVTRTIHFKGSCISRCRRLWKADADVRQKPGKFNISEHLGRIAQTILKSALN